MITAVDLIKQIRISIHDEDMAEFTNDELITYINKGQIQFMNIIAGRNILFNIDKFQAVSNKAVLPLNCICIYKVMYNGKEILKGDIEESNKYFIIGKNIHLPVIPADVYYFKNFPQVNSSSKIEYDDFIIDYIHQYTVINALSRLEFNTSKEEKMLSNTLSLIIDILRRRCSFEPLKRYGDYKL